MAMMQALRSLRATVLGLEGPTVLRGPDDRWAELLLEGGMSADVAVRNLNSWKAVHSALTMETSLGWQQNSIAHFM